MNAVTQIAPVVANTNVEAEQAIVGGLLTDNSLLVKIEHLTAVDFSDLAYSRIFSEIRAMVSEGLEANPVTIKSRIADLDFGGKNPVKALILLQDGAATALNITSFAKTVSDCSAKRKLAELGDQLKSGKGTVAELLARVQAEVSKSQPANDAGIALSFHGDGAAVVKRSELVKGILPTGEVCILSGQSGAGKTFVALEMAACLGTGRDFFGHAIPERGGTLLLLGEGVGTISERLEAAKIAHGADKSLSIAWVPLSGSLGTPAYLNAIIAGAKRASREFQKRHGFPLRLIVVDTLAAAFSIGDENDAAKATEAMRALQRLHIETGALVVAVAHHGKSDETGVRGSSAYTASADAILTVKANRDGAGLVTGRSLSLTKSRWRETGQAFGFELCGVPVGTDDDGEIVFSPHVRQVETIAAKTEKSVPSGRKLFLACLTDALVDFGKKHHVGGANGAVVQAVEESHVRREFDRRMAETSVEGDTPKKLADRQRANWQNNRKALLNSQAIGAERVSESEVLLWKL